MCVHYNTKTCVSNYHRKGHININKITRSANSVAHLLAKGAYSMSGLQEWVHTAPDFLICNLDLDMV